MPAEETMSRISEIIEDRIRKSSSVDRQLAEIDEVHQNKLDDVILLTLRNI